MKLLLLSHEYRPLGAGAANALLHLVPLWAELGWEVKLLTSHAPGLPEREEGRGWEVRRIRCGRTALMAPTAPEILGYAAAGLLEGRRLGRSWRPHVCLAFFAFPAGVIARALHSLQGIPFVVSLRGSDVPGYSPERLGKGAAVYGSVYRWVVREAGAVVANSQGLKELAQKASGEKPVQMIPNGVALDGPPLGRKGRIGTLSLLGVGQMIQRKGFGVLLEALAGLTEADWRLTLVGEGPERENLQNLAKERGIENRVVFTGLLSRENLLPLYREADLFLHPSRAEGMPNVVLEAMAAGLPVIATNVSGNSELVSDGINGYLVPWGNTEDLRQTLRRLFNDSPLRLQMGEASAVRVQDYRWEEVAGKYDGLLRTLVDSERLIVDG